MHKSPQPDLNANINMWMFSRYNVYHNYHPNLAWQVYICKLALNALQLRVMGMSLFPQMFGHRPKQAVGCWTNKLALTLQFDQIVSLSTRRNKLCLQPHTCRCIQGA